MQEINFGRMIRIIHWHMDQVFNNFLREYNLTLSQVEILRYLNMHRNEEVHQKDIEKFFHISNPTVSGLLNRLEEKGFIVRETDLNDTRKKSVKSTNEALAMAKKLKKTMDQFENDLLSALNNDERQRLKEYLMRIIDSGKKD